MCLLGSLDSVVDRIIILLRGAAVQGKEQKRCPKTVAGTLARPLSCKVWKKDVTVIFSVTSFYPKTVKTESYRRLRVWDAERNAIF